MIMVKHLGRPSSVTILSVSQDLAASLRRLLEAIERGDLDASTPRAIALRRRIEGAVIALEAARTKPSHSRGMPRTPTRKGKT